MVHQSLEFEAHSNYVISVMYPGTSSELVTAGMDKAIRH